MVLRRIAVWESNIRLIQFPGTIAGISKTSPPVATCAGPLKNKEVNRLE